MVARPWAKEKARQLSGKYIDQALDDLSKNIVGKDRRDIQKQLAKLGNYCGTGTKLVERLASDDPKSREPLIIWMLSASNMTLII